MKDGIVGATKYETAHLEGRMQVNVHPVGHSNSMDSLANARRAKHSEEPAPADLNRKQSAKPERHASSAADEPVDTSSREEDEGTKAAGVLRLLEEGHFKGVADVRSRINFFDELSAQAGSRAAATAREQAAEFVEGVRGQVGELIGPLAEDADAEATIEELLGHFDSAVQAGLMEHVRDDGVDIESLSGALQSALGALVEGLRALLTAPGEGEDAVDHTQDPSDPVEEVQEEISGVGQEASFELAVPTAPSAVEDVADTPSSGGAEDFNAILDGALASLSSTFEDLLSRLLDAVRGAAHLPDPSPPSGKGAAYDKFLAIYNELRGSAAGVDQLA
ncbi:MAG: hypothetical protein JSU68_15185 [Phycisphaerales bacterium]|nr:MAG: hypothetical protein JSU68_15185 [Phycisphaerales bacterium]